MYKYDLGQTVYVVAHFLFSTKRERSESSRERERERETKRSLPLCIAAACGEDSEHKVVAL